jgi:SAM-dependent methyltransferase
MTTIVGANKSQRTYLPATGHDLFLPLYDLMARLLGADQARQSLLDEASLRCGDRALDIGCGTGTFAVLLKQRFPTVEVIGLDPDRKALARARRKAERAGVSVRFDQGFADALEYPAGGFDVVFFFVHVPPSRRQGQREGLTRGSSCSQACWDFLLAGLRSGTGWISARLLPHAPLK